MARIRVSELAKKTLEQTAERTGSTQRELASMFVIQGANNLDEEVMKDDE